MHLLSAIPAQLDIFGSWVAAPPDPGLGNAPPGVQQKVGQVVSLVAWLAVAACVLGVLIVALRMAVLHGRGELQQHMAGLGSVIGACVLIGTAAGLVATFV